MKIESPVIHTVHGLTLLIKRSLEKDFSGLWVQGEITNFKRSPSGHFYFDLKDESAQISVALFKGIAMRIGLPSILGLDSFSQLDDFRTVQGKVNGKTVKVSGSLTVYEKSGRYNLIADFLEMEGLGDLHQKFEELKKRLHAKGYFDVSRKRKIPLYPSAVGIVTSPNGAAIRDMLNILKRRWPGLSIILYPSLVQGKEAAMDIANGIRLFNHYKNVDVIIVGRGGGSIEDLWAFNEEIVADAIFHSNIPVISAVGHEIDFTISDFTADLRAPTPSAAAELVVRVKEEVQDSLDQAAVRMEKSLRNSIGRLRERMEAFTRQRLVKGLRHAISLLGERLKSCSQETMARALRSTASQGEMRLTHLSDKLMTGMQNLQTAWKNRVFQLSDKLNLLDPLNILQRGYSVTYDAETGMIIRESAQVTEGSLIRTALSKGELVSRVERGDRR
jgi:exodeoxyribonuclease VII large subunit